METRHNRRIYIFRGKALAIDTKITRTVRTAPMFYEEACDKMQLHTYVQMNMISVDHLNERGEFKFKDKEERVCS